MRYKIEIADDEDNSCQIALKIPFGCGHTNPGNSTWKLLTPGALAHQSGGCQQGGGAFGSPLTIYLMFAGKYGLTITAMFDGLLLVNDSGAGSLAPFMASNVVKAGAFGWTLID